MDRLWPRGLSKRALKADLRVRDIAPSDGLRKWFSHDPAKWDGFGKRYKTELEGKKGLVKMIKQIEKEKTTVTLVYAAKDPEHNNAVALMELLKR